MEQLTGTLSDAPATNDYEKLNNKPLINGVELQGDKSLSELGMDVVFVSKEELADGLSVKADSETVNRALDLKADTAAVDQALSGKADNVTVNQALAGKADTVTMNQALAGKASETEFQALKDRVDALVDGNEVEF